jgi:hypothetical protein
LSLKRGASEAERVGAKRERERVLPAGAKAVMEVRPRQSERAAAWAFMVEMDGCAYVVVREEAERSKSVNEE